MYQLDAPDCNGTVKPFEKPWLVTALMFLAMAMCLPVAWIQQRWESAQLKEPQQRVQPQQVCDDAQGRGDSQAHSLAGAPAAVVKVAVAAAAAAAAAGAAAADEENDLRLPLLDSNSDQQTQPQQQQQQVTVSLLEGVQDTWHDVQHGSGDRMGGSNGKSISKLQQALWLCVPTGFDLVSTVLYSVGLLYITASGELAFGMPYPAVLQHSMVSRPATSCLAISTAYS